MGRSDGLVVFVPRTAPGDRIHARWSEAGRFARGQLVEVAQPSPARVDPPCVHYRADRCGGCQLQHLTIGAQHEAKRQIVADALTRIGHRAELVDLVIPSPREWRYRRKLTLALRRRGGRWIGGLHRFDAPGEVFELDDCPITDERVVAVWRRVLGASALLPTDTRELRGAVRLLSAPDEAEIRAAFTLEGGTRWPSAEAFFAAIPELVGLWWRAEGRAARLIHDRHDTAAGGASFVQVNPSTADLLERDVLAEVRAGHPRRFVDAYAGAGAVAAAVAGDGVDVVAIELDPEAVAIAAARLAPLGGRAIAARVEDVIAATLPADVILVNPPRAGLEPAVCDALERAAADDATAPRRLVYVSCNPATLARDLARLPSYAVRRVTPFDMFPQTAHVETLVVLAPSAGLTRA